MDYKEKPKESLEDIIKEIKRLKLEIKDFETEIDIRVKDLKKIVDSRWGFLMRAGNGRSLIAKQIARHADIYSSRVSSFLNVTPYWVFESQAALFPHDSMWLKD